MREISFLADLRKFKAEELNVIHKKYMDRLTKKIRKDIITMIANSGSGHLGGSLSSTDVYTMLWLCANVGIDMLDNPDRDRIIVSHGHTAAGVYSVLGNLGYNDLNEILGSFRKDGSVFEGHPSLKVSGVEWCSGSLGQGLSVGCGYALASRIKEQNYHVFVVMGDGEQCKGQICEAREFAMKYRLNNLTAVIDCNNLQASGLLKDIMPQNIERKYASAGWNILSIDGHDYTEIYKALKTCYYEKNVPTLLLANTVMGKGLSFIENNYEYHGKVLTNEQNQQALEDLYCDEEILYETVSKKENTCANERLVEYRVNFGNPIVYEKGKEVDCRTAFGEALCDIAASNRETNGVFIAAIDCDLAESVKLQKFGAKFPNGLIECGIQEHNAATVAGALSKSGILTFFADFGVFGIDETYGQHRMNDLNNTSVKLICTHNGLDVGEDGKTHQCIDYISNMSNLFGFKILIPADANQTDRIIRYAATNPGNMLVAMGHSKLPVLTKEDGSIFFDRDYLFEYGKADWLRKGADGTIITCGTMVCKSVRIHEILKERGTEIGILNLSCPSELDYRKINEASNTGLIITYEDHNIRTGIGSIIGTCLAENGMNCDFKRIGITQYGVSASPEYQYRIQSLDEDSVVKIVEQKVKNIRARRV